MIINYNFQNLDLLKTALTHPSLSKDKNINSYEKLEFLGDNILNLMLAEIIYNTFTDLNEGKLSQIHSNLVCTSTLANIANILKLGQEMILDKGEEANGGRANEKNLENCLEALIAAVFLDSNYQTVVKVFLPFWQPFLDDKNYAFKRDAKSLLQEWSQKNKLGIPKYLVVAEEGLAHNKIFTISLDILGYTEVHSQSSSIKKAQILAAEKFIEINGVENE